MKMDYAVPVDVEHLEQHATTAFLAGRAVDFQDCLDRLHRFHLEHDDEPAAARCAFWISLCLLLHGQVAQANAWVERGKRLVQDRDCVERGYLGLMLAEHQLRGGDADAGHETAASCVAIAERFRDADLTACARHVQGRACIQQNRVLAGLGLLDETMLAATAGELSPIMTGLMYCSVIEACRNVYAVSRAHEWTAALTRWCARQDEPVAFTSVCLVHRAELMQFRGAWLDALAEACLACARAAQADRKPPAAAFYQQGEIHRLRGEFDKAEEAYREASRLGREPQPGLALLRLAQGQVGAACAAIRRLMSVATDRVERARLLPAQLEIMLARIDDARAPREEWDGMVQEAHAACEELQSLADAFHSDVPRAVVAQARGALALAAGDARAALAPLRQAFELWERLDAPHESARVRVLLGVTCRAVDDHEASALELTAARAAFEQLGAAPDLARLDAVASEATTTADRRSGQARVLTARERDVLRLIAVGHTNKAIAATLHVSARTIDRHVSNIFDKLDVPSRAAATAYAFHHNLL